MNVRASLPRKKLLVTALLAALAPGAQAQVADATHPADAQETSGASDPAKELGTIEVTGIRHSLAESMGIKRGSDGVVDGIVAEDIGKFPDTNLAESLQHISGDSIDRST